ncbi:phospholipid transport system transporter-binding protein [Ruminobacter amylophilus]|uniref:Phospholipid transport system transporter-binding protein n=1 Tax=Ruminobacter amylophilus TaxID=867 RepID=A0A662ZKF8_9GAMM|nr:STAS domain-containing protein [Ruminobacter amylophilus]SFP61202.1 phospholipid transport system transporter-binding protein [Ruminobacter amylophilus]
MKIEGALDFNSVEKLWKDRKTLFSDSVADLSSVDKIDSAGISFLVLWAKEHENRLRIIKPPKEAINLIKLFKLNDLFSVETD